AENRAFAVGGPSPGLITGGRVRYLMKQNLFSMEEDYTVRDERGRDHYVIAGGAARDGDRLSFQDTRGRELAYVRRRVPPAPAPGNLRRPGRPRRGRRPDPRQHHHRGPLLPALLRERAGVRSRGRRGCNIPGARA